MTDARRNPPERMGGQTMADPWPSDGARASLARFLSRVLIAVGIAALLFLVWKGRDAFLLALAAVVVGVLLDAAARPIHRSTPLSRRWALAVAGIVLGAVIALLVWLVGSHVQSQIGQLITQLSEASRSIEQRVGVPLLGDGGQEMGVDWTVLQRIASYGITIIGALGSLVLVIAGGFFLAADPRIYRRGVVKLLPKRHHARAEDALEPALHRRVLAADVVQARREDRARVGGVARGEYSGVFGVAFPGVDPRPGCPVPVRDGV